MPTWLDWFTEALAKYPSPQAYYDDYKAYHAPLYDAVVRACPPPARLLEVGAGIGWSARALAERGYAVTALEPDQAVWELYDEVDRKLLALPPLAAGLWFMKFTLGQATVADIGQPFDVVTCLGLLEHHDAPDRAVMLGQLAMLAPIVVVAIPAPLGLELNPPTMGEQAIELADLMAEVDAAGLQVVSGFGWGKVPGRVGDLSYCVVGRRWAVQSETVAEVPQECPPGRTGGDSTTAGNKQIG